MRKDHKGFSVVEVIIILLVISVIGGIGWYVLDKRDNKESVNTETTSSSAKETAASEKSDGYKWSTSAQGPYHDKVSYATSADLMNWTDSGKILIEHASVPDVMLKNGTLHMYFVDVSTDGKPEQLGLMKSTDNGKNWSGKQIVTIKGVGVANKIPVDPDPVLLPDGRIRIYYFDISARSNMASKAKNRIYSAVSSDGLNFTQEDGVRFEDDNIFDPDVLKVGDTWRLYVGNPEGQKVISAISKDGLTFAKEGIAYEGSSVPNAIFEGGKYYLYTAGIQIATSTDGKTYTKTNSSFNSAGGVTADPGVVKLGDNNYLMIYKTSDAAAQGPPTPGTPQ